MSNTHTKDLHSKCIDDLCRLCFRLNYRSIKQKRLFLCTNYASDIKEFIGIDIKNDSKGKHSVYMCNSC